MKGACMSDKENVVLEDGERMLSPVPMSERRPTFNQIMVWVGFGYVVTGLFIGGVLAGFWRKAWRLTSNCHLGDHFRYGLAKYHHCATWHNGSKNWYEPSSNF